MRKINFANNEFYHIYNRGADKRDIFLDGNDLRRIFQSIKEFNVIEPIGSIYENSFNNRQLGNRVSKVSKLKKLKKLVNIVCYCVNPNHYHFILEQVADKGVEKFMHKFGLGYTKYFNAKYHRSGGLFQGAYKAIHIDSNEYLLHSSVYVNLNDKVHRLGNSVSKSSWEEYTGGKVGICEKDIILGQFKNIKDYKEFAEDALNLILEKKDMKKEAETEAEKEMNDLICFWNNLSD